MDGGADLVLELPMTLAVNAAGYFAAGAVDCLTALHGVDDLCFGSEGMRTETLLETARQMETPEYETALRAALSGGVSYARAREQALAALGGDGACLTTPNNALGVDYLRRLIQTDSPLEPLAIPRKTGLPPASELRRSMSGDGVHTLNNGERAILAVLRTLPDSAFEAMPFGAEGLWSKVMKACRRESTLEDILFACKSKRYAMSRLRRMLLCLFLGLGRAHLDREIPYLRVLAFNERGRAMLHSLKRTSELPLVSGTLPDSPEAMAYYAMECRATDLYGLFAPAGQIEPVGRERRQGPVYRKK